MLGVDLSELARLGELSQGPVELDQELRVLGPDRQGHVPALARNVLGHEPQTAELRVLVQVPGREVGVEERGVQRRGPKPSSSSSRVLNRATVWSFSERATVPVTIPTRLPRRSARE